MGRFLRKSTRVLMLVSGVGALAYFLDPRSGRVRRAKAKDQAAAKLRRTRREAQQKASYLGGKVEGVVHTVTKPGDQPPQDDKTLVDKIKSEVLGGAEFEGHQVVVDAADGVVALRGEVKRPEQVKELEAAVRKVPGVRDVENFVHLPATPPPNKQDSLGQ